MSDFQARLEAEKAGSTLQLLFKVARLLNEQAIERINMKRGQGERLRPSHMTLIPHLSLTGSRITTLAEKLQISKQAVGQLVEEMQQMGIVCRIPDPSDGRAKLVQFSEQGRKGMFEGLRLLKDMEDELQELFGAKRMQDLRITLTKLLRHVDT